LLFIEPASVGARLTSCPATGTDVNEEGREMVSTLSESLELKEEGNTDLH
jgi:hypothetical protein